MTVTDPSARVAHGAVIGKDVTIGPYCVIEANAIVFSACPRHRHASDRAQRFISLPLGTPPQSVAARLDQAHHRHRSVRASP